MPSRLWRDQKVWPSSWSNFVHPQRNQPSAPGYICPSRLHRPQRCRVALHHRQLVHLCRSRWTQCRSSWVINTRITHIKRMALVTAGHAVPFATIVPIFLKFGPASQWPQPLDWPANHSPMPLPLLTASIQTPGPRSSLPQPLKLNLEALSHWGTIPHKVPDRFPRRFGGEEGCKSFFPIWNSRIGPQESSHEANSKLLGL